MDLPPDLPSDDALARAVLLPLPDGFVAGVMAGLPARRRASSFPALIRVAAALLLAIGASLAIQGLSPAAARAEAPALLRRTIAPVVAAAPRPALESAAVPLEVLPSTGSAATVLGAAGLGLALLVGGLLLARRALARPTSASPTPSPDAEEARP